MTALLKSEWLKMTTTRAFLGMIAAASALATATAFALMAQGPPPWNVDGAQLAGMGGIIAISTGLLGLFLGQRTFTDEFRYGTIAHTTFSDPHRTRMTVAKSVVAAAGATLMTLTAIIVAAFAVAVIASLSGGGVDVGEQGVRVVAGLLAGGALWAVFGVGMAAVIRQPVAAVTTGLLWVLVVENVGSAFLGNITRFLPGQVARSMAAGGPQAEVAAAVLAGWSALMLLTGWMVLRHRDVIT